MNKTDVQKKKQNMKKKGQERGGVFTLFGNLSKSFVQKKKTNNNMRVAL